MRIGEICDENLEYKTKSHAYQAGVNPSDIVVVCNEMDVDFIAGEIKNTSPRPPLFIDSRCPAGRFFLYTKAELRVLHPEATETFVGSAGDPGAIIRCARCPDPKKFVEDSQNTIRETLSRIDQMMSHNIPVQMNHVGSVEILGSKMDLLADERVPKDTAYLITEEELCNVKITNFK